MNNEDKVLEMLGQINDHLGRIEDVQTEQGKTMAGHGKLLEELDARSQRTAVLMETDITDRLQLLYEGHKTIMEQMRELAGVDRVAALEDDVAMMKDVIKLMRQEIAELKKAQ